VLYEYPAGATAENWLHDVLVEVVTLVNEKVAANQDLPEWPLIIPEDYKDVLVSRHGLEAKINLFNEALKGLTDAERGSVLQALSQQNDIPALTSCTSNCCKIDALPAAVQKPIKDLFIFAFGLLSAPAIGIRDRHYKAIYEATEHHICPFCGLEYFDAPGAPREDYDHYLLKDDYPFAAANLRNLAPMGGRCNSSYKKMQDMLVKADGTRRRSFDPYNHESVTISLENSEPFEGKNGKVPKWKIDFQPASEAVETWDEVFHLRERYERDVLDEYFESWLRGFRSWCRSVPTMPSSDVELYEVLDRYSIFLEEGGLSDRAFLKAAVFRMLQRSCQQNNDRVIQFLKDVLN